ncbi:hypothetical protein SMQC13_00910 [Serratia marcescens]|nr:hypothetical protein SMQC13_00910 [Serratia marcescens]
MNETYYYGQGKVFLSRRSSTEQSGRWRWVGDVSTFNVSFSSEQKVRSSAMGGKVVQTNRFITSTTGSVIMKWHDISAENLAIAFYGEHVTSRQNWVPNEPLPTGISAGDKIYLQFQNVRDVSISGLKEGIDYTVDAIWGAVVFLRKPKEKLLYASYDYASCDAIPFLTATSDEFSLRFESINIAENERRMLVELYRINIDPINIFEFISNGNSLNGMDTSGLILHDMTKPRSQPLGQFGRIVMFNDFQFITYDGSINFDGSHNFAY